MTPNLFIIGAPKTGTTALAQYLSEHPRVFFSNPKEPFYLCTDYPHLKEQHFLETDDDYLALFEKADPAQHKVIGEGSTNYLRSAEAVKNALKLNPEAKFIAMLRNPVQVAHAFHMEELFARNEDEPDFEKAWRLQESRRAGQNIPPFCRAPEFLQYGEIALFSDQIRRFMETVPEGQRLILLQDDLKADTGAVYRQALAFLNLPDDGRTEFPVLNSSHTHRSELIARMVLSPPKVLAGPVWALRGWLRRTKPPAIEKLKAYLRKDSKRTPLSPAFEAELYRFFHDDVVELESLLGRDLSGWKRPPAQTR